MTKELVDGLNICNNVDYHADRKYLSSSVLKKIYHSLDEYYEEYVLGYKKPFGNQSALDEGSLVHAQILEPDVVAKEFIFYPGLRKSGADFEAFKAGLQPGHRIIISKPQKLRVESYIEAYKKRPEAVAKLSGGVPEQTICGQLNGVNIKVRFDYINVDEGYIADIKTTGYPADIDSFKQTLNGLKYQLSAALYCAMAEQFYGKKFDFYFVVISKQDPQECHVYKTSEKTMLEGRKMVDEACAKYLLAKQLNIWSEAELAKLNPVQAPPLDSSYEILEV